MKELFLLPFFYSIAVFSQDLLVISNPIENPNFADELEFSRTLHTDRGFLFIASRADYQHCSQNLGSGAVYVYESSKPDTRSVICEPNFSGLESEFGMSISSRLDEPFEDSYLAISAPHSEVLAGNATIFDSGQVHLYRGSKSGKFIHQYSLPRFEGDIAQSESLFGFSTAIIGRTLVVGVPHYDELESPSSICGDCKNVGRVYFFDLESGSLIRTIRNPQTHRKGEFGYKVESLSDNYVIISAPGNDSASFLQAGAVYIADVASGAIVAGFSHPHPNGDFVNQFGASVASLGMGRFAVGDPLYSIGSAHEAGAVYILKLSRAQGGRKEGGLGINHEATLFSEVSDDRHHFGKALAPVSEQLLLVGAPGNSVQEFQDGAAFIFDVLSGQSVQRFFNPEVLHGFDHFGASLSYWSELKAVVIGAPRKSIEDGAFLTGRAYLGKH